MDDKTLISLKELREIQAIAQTGMSYSQNEYDKERYHQLLLIAADILARNSTEKETDKVKNWCFDEIGYATPKIAVRMLVINDKSQVLMVKERSNGLWALPGGWADVNLSAAESAEKELFEETGLTGTATKLLALFDKLKHNHPPHWPHTYLVYFLGKITGGMLHKNSSEISDVNYFDMDNLPNICLHRGTKAQIQLVFKKALQSEKSEVLFD